MMVIKKNGLFLGLGYTYWKAAVKAMTFDDLKDEISVRNIIGNATIYNLPYIHSEELSKSENQWRD